MESPTVLINAFAGGAYGSAPAAASIVGRVYAEFGIAADISIVAPDAFEDAVRRACRRQRPIVIGGGDGSVSAAIQHIVGTDIPLGVLPLGTYNLLAQDLGLSGDLSRAVALLADGSTRRIDLGLTHGHYFHTLAGLGFFARTARERASIRRRLPGMRAIGAVIAAWRSLSGQGKLDVEIDDGRDKRRLRSPALLVTNNLLDATRWRRPRLDGGVLELHAANDSLHFPLLQGGFAAMRGTWRQHPGVEIWSAPEIELRFRRPRVFVSLDGEVHRQHTPLRLSIARGALVCMTGEDGK